MLNIVNRLFKPLTTVITQSIVIRYTPKRSVFNKTTYNQDWIPQQKIYNKHRKPRLPQWDNPDIIYPKLIPALYKPCSYKHYIRNYIQQQQKQKALRSKEYILNDIRTGDIVDITYQQTFQNDQTVTHRGLVLSFKRKRSYTAAMELAIRFGGMSIKCIYLIHSPKIKKIQLISKGSGCFQGNMKHDWQKLNKTQLTTPRIRKRVMKPRQQTKKKRAGAKSKSSSTRYDKIQTDNVKRLI